MRDFPALSPYMAERTGNYQTVAAQTGRPSGGRHVENLTRAHRPETAFLHSLLRQRCLEGHKRRIHRLIGELYRTPMVAADMRRTAKFHAFHSFRRVLVLALHEPARLVSAEGQVGEAELAMFLARGVIVESLMEAGIAGKSCRQAFR